AAACLSGSSSPELAPEIAPGPEPFDRAPRIAPARIGPDVRSVPNRREAPRSIKPAFGLRATEAIALSGSGNFSDRLHEVLDARRRHRDDIDVAGLGDEEAVLHDRLLVGRFDDGDQVVGTRNRVHVDDLAAERFEVLSALGEAIGELLDVLFALGCELHKTDEPGHVDLLSAGVGDRENRGERRTSRSKATLLEGSECVESWPPKRRRGIFRGFCQYLEHDWEPKTRSME